MNESHYLLKELEGVMGTAAKVLAHKGMLQEAAILANAEHRLQHQNHDNWDGGQDYWRLYLGIPVETYLTLPDPKETAKLIAEAVAIPLRAVSSSDFIDAEIVTALERNLSWREDLRQHLSGDAINNQGRVRSDNVAAREHEGLLFRSRPEVCFFNALKAVGAVFAPLSVVVCGSTLGEKPRRIEPDFVIYKGGLVTVVEIDGDLFHTETPVQAHQRLKFLTDEGPHLERISASECDSPQKAREAAQAIMLGIEKRLRSRLP